MAIAAVKRPATWRRRRDPIIPRLRQDRIKLLGVHCRRLMVMMELKCAEFGTMKEKLQKGEVL